jgi:membrane-associated protease RseP (regulator of RpoE activity)
MELVRRSARPALSVALVACVVFAVATLRQLGPATLAWGAIVAAGLLVMLTVIVVVHELSHLAAGRLLGVRSDAFSVGFGRELLGIDRAGIRWSIRAIPLGGYVRLVGEEDPDVPGGLAAAGPLRTCLVYVAGPVANVGVAAIAAACLALSQGVEPIRVPYVVGAILWTSLALTARLVAEWLPTMLSNLAAMPLGGLPSMFVAFGEALRNGPYLVTLLFVLLNLSIGLMNLLPIPPLDGGQAALSVARARLGDRLPEVAIRRAMRLGFAGLLTFMVAVNVVDLLRWTVGGYTLGT